MKKWVLVALATIVAFAAVSNVNACWGNGCRGGYDDYNYYYGNGAYGYGGNVYAAPGYYYVPPHYGYADYYPYWGYGGGYAYSYSYTYSYNYGYRAPSYRNSEMAYYCRNGWC